MLVAETLAFAAVAVVGTLLLFLHALNVAVTAMPVDDSGAPDLAIARRSLPGLSDEQLLRHPGVLSGSTDEIAERLRGYRDTYGISYVIVQARHVEAFGKVIALLK